MEEYQKIIPNLEPFSLDISAIQYKCYTWKVPSTDYEAGLIAFYGVYGYGSAGKDDAEFIKWRVMEFLEMPLHYPKALLIDFRNLDYRMGNEMYEIASDFGSYRLSEPGDVPVRIVINPEEVQPEIYKAYQWALPTESIRTDFQQAYAEINQLLQAEHKRWHKPSERGE